MQARVSCISIRQLLNRQMANLPICSVQTDNFNATKELTKYLFKKGHKKIGLSLPIAK